VDRTEAYAIALVENVQCSNLTLLEEAQAYAVLQEQGQTQAAIGCLIDKGQSYIAHKLRLLRLPPLLITYLEAGLVTENHVR
jgi:ParB family chromosome partitioning protein